MSGEREFLEAWKEDFKSPSGKDSTMNVISLPRDSGKTTLIVEWVKQKPEFRIMVVFNGAERDRVIGLGLDYRQVFTFREILEDRGFGVTRRGEMMIDNLDICIKNFSPLSDCFKLVGFSVTNEPEE